MKRSILATVATVALMAGSLMIATPASALRTSVGGKTCSVTAYKAAYGASSQRGTCGSVRSRANVRDSGGTLRTVTGSWGSYSSATGATTMVTARAVNVSFNGATTGWIGY